MSKSKRKSKSKWISVDRRMPRNSSDDVIVGNLPRRITFHALAYYVKTRGKWHWSVTNQEVDSFDIITHWQFLPTYPK